MSTKIQDHPVLVLSCLR